MKLGVHDRILLVRGLGMSSGQPMGDCWEILEWTLAGQCGSFFGWKFPDRSHGGNLDGVLV